MGLRPIMKTNWIFFKVKMKNIDMLYSNYLNWAIQISKRILNYAKFNSDGSFGCDRHNFADMRLTPIMQTARAGPGHGRR